jgi:C4-dicarboxylate transporter DctM subunit
MATYIFVTFAITAILGFPIWAVLAISSFTALTFASTTPIIVVVQRLFTAVDSFPLLAVPLFMVAGNLMETGGISRRLINFCNAILGSLPGGLAMAAVLTCMFFAAISGSGPATVAAIGGIMIPEMERAGYDKAFSAAVMSVAGAIGVIIPPSIPMVNFGVVGSVSISTLFAAGFGPGILVGISLMIVCFFTAKKHGYGQEGAQKFSISNIIKEFLHAFWALLMPVIILGGIYGGIFTPTEAAAVSVIYGFLVGLVIYRELPIKKIPPMFMAAGKSTAMVMMIIATASGFGWILTSARIPDAIAAGILSLTSSKIMVLLLINILLLIVGCLMETTAAIIILTPIFLPITTALGVNPVHFGIIMVVNLAIGMSTPPLGVNLFVACGIAKISLESITKAIVWLLIANIIALFLITYVEPISMFIPNAMGIK